MRGIIFFITTIVMQFGSSLILQGLSVSGADQGLCRIVWGITALMCLTSFSVGYYEGHREGKKIKTEKKKPKTPISKPTIPDF